MINCLRSDCSTSLNPNCTKEKKTVVHHNDCNNRWVVTRVACFSWQRSFFENPFLTSPMLHLAKRSAWCRSCASASDGSEQLSVCVCVNGFECVCLVRHSKIPTQRSWDESNPIQFNLQHSITQSPQQKSRPRQSRTQKKARKKRNNDHDTICW